MKKISLADKNNIQNTFEKSIYINSHFGWLDLWDLFDPLGEIWFDDVENNKYLIALQKAAPFIFWLHSFYSSSYPDQNLPFDQFKKILPPGRNSIYTISSHQWYSSFLENNRFLKTDEIIQLETDAILCSKPGIVKSRPFSLDQAKNIWKRCESTFPPLWRLSCQEFQKACMSSNYRRICVIDNAIVGYILANIEDGICDVERIAVLQSYCNNGLGTGLITDLVTSCNDAGIKEFSVNTNKNNASAVQFYEKMNFKPVGTRYPIYHRSIYGSIDKK